MPALGSLTNRLFLVCVALSIASIGAAMLFVSARLTREHDRATATRQAETVAAELVEGRIDAGAAITATHYHATTVSPRWAGKLKRVARIGRHIFYAG